MPCSASALMTSKSSGSNASSYARVVHAYIRPKDKALRNLIVKCDKREVRQRDLKMRFKGFAREEPLSKNKRSTGALHIHRPIEVMC
jgi:hypothetical protein